MNPEMHYKIVAVLTKLFPNKHVSVEVDCKKHVYPVRPIDFEFRLYVADAIYEEFDNVVDLLAYVKTLSDRSEITVSPETLKFSDFERQTGHNL